MSENMKLPYCYDPGWDFASVFEVLSDPELGEAGEQIRQAIVTCEDATEENVNHIISLLIEKKEEFPDLEDTWDSAIVILSEIPTHGDELEEISLPEVFNRMVFGGGHVF
ncbi:hypothetical protein [Brunnivagina elsteri]|uniref:Uncharacterized protein n=1 Tax=Brunnivagina elsteri CCALA 953 TaxID=987040 RepID=A0A2A2TGW4_9CYAN|nr:hypothetical protein [Calothrix elsteri]PAX52868.1 hypothetical protein CK510_17065 [Calothrix elsteri CCALA 953]